MNKEELTAMVADILRDMGREPTVKGSDYRPTTPGPVSKDAGYREGDFVPDVTQLDLRKLYLTENPANKEQYARMKLRTPARLGSGKAGARYKTLTMLRFRADHAAAQDAAFSQIPEDFPEKNGLVPVLKSHGRGFVEKPYIRIVGKTLCGHLFGVRQRIRVGKYQREKYDGGKSREGEKRNDEHFFNGSRLSLSFGFFAVCVFPVRFPHILLFPVFFFHISSFSTGRATVE